MAFGILGTNAASDIPELVAMMDDPNCPRTARRAIAALSSLGAPAFPQMTAALSNTSHPNRDIIAAFLFWMAHDIGTNACLPPLTAALDDPDPQVRGAASRALYRLTNAPAQ
jgi:HEAT repeat protein